ncbi:hypothetical protein VTP01DRAFT_7268 [Rhizomucor pusillus]|uniref:uncharacterized protein n=1 Tax=Rhizomucor pusillus TaxID=4840 RepID=UPI0037435953
MGKDSLGGGIGMVEHGLPSASIQNVRIYTKGWPGGFLKTNPNALGMHRYQFARIHLHAFTQRILPHLERQLQFQLNLDHLLAACQFLIPDLHLEFTTNIAICPQTNRTFSNFLVNAKNAPQSTVLATTATSEELASAFASTTFFTVVLSLQPLLERLQRAAAQIGAGSSERIHCARADISDTTKGRRYGNAGDHDAGMDMDVHVENECHAESDNFVIGSAPLPDVDDNAFDDDEAFDGEHGQGMESVADQE